ncbi:ABC transporter permease [Nocardioides sp. zg-DK7169]|uniref:ABC transporter permease n=1 Tax=Nocardioides sp. zg-DK7169 TaxID=2736600 RepID=UPI00155534F5|nr:ABC transporter permease [Nocardioides sp. zg-DK7169]NPC97613.1 ABC transporter permease [Nocardioides sp. zg-DK7169]
MSARSLLDRYLVLVTTPLLALALIGGWQLYVELSDVSPFIVPPPGDVWTALRSQVSDPYIWKVHVWTTFVETVLGLLIGAVIGVGAGFAIGKSRILNLVLKPFLVLLQVTPKVALAPLFVLWFGFGEESKIALAALVCFFPLMVNTAFGIQSLPQGHTDMASSIGAGRVFRFLRVEVPHTMAFILAGLEQAIVLATIGAIVGEYLGGDKGLGRYALNLQNNLQIDLLFGAIVLMALYGLVLYLAVTSLKRFLIPWHESVRLTRPAP